MPKQTQRFGFGTGQEHPWKGLRAGEIPFREHGGGRPQQLSMLMSTREIMSQYQPLDADRNEVYDPREGEPTGRAETTAGHPNPLIRTVDRDAPFLKDAPASATHYRNYEVPETHAQMMDRKLEEAQMPHHEYVEHHRAVPDKTPGWETMMGMTGAPQYRSGHTGTYDYEMNQHIENEESKHWERSQESVYGTMQKAMAPGGEGFTGLIHLATGQFGEQGKPQLAGGHHRLASLEHIAPDRLLPVIHHQTMGAARHPESTQNFPYT